MTNEQNETKLTPEQIAESMIRGYETDSGVVMGIRWAQIPSLRILLVEAARRAMKAQADELIDLQANVRSIREDYHGPRPSADERAVMDERLNAVEAKIGDLIRAARGEG